LFRTIKNVLDVRVAIDRRSGQPRGFAHADFIDVESAVKAKEILEEKSVYGRQLRVDYSGQMATRPEGDRPDRGSRYEGGDRPDRGSRYEGGDRPNRGGDRYERRDRGGDSGKYERRGRDSGRDSGRDGDSF
jgi:nucleolin